MSGAQIGFLEALELDRVTRWRFDELVRAGYDDDDALEIACRLDIDLHAAIELMRQGCPSRIAARITL